MGAKFDFTEYWEVGRWPRKWRRAYLILAPVTFPIWFVTMLPVLWLAILEDITREVFGALIRVWKA